jgi:xanthine dehydrogenase accessory factor
MPWTLCTVPETLRATALHWLATGQPAMLVQVAQTRGSVPRETGTRMLVSSQATAGTIGGGHLELQAIAQARAMLAQGQLQTHLQHYALGPSLGQCCGGALDVRTERLQALHLSDWPTPPPLFHLQLYGAGHVGRAIAKLLDDLPCQVQWIDEREDEFPAQPGAAHVKRCCVEPVQAEVRSAPPGSFYLVLTHRHDLDLALCEAILARGDFGYLGLIGSHTKRQRFFHRFEAKGVSAETLARITCPIGLPGISGKQPELIAVAVVAQLLQQAGAQA